MCKWNAKKINSPLSAPYTTTCIGVRATLTGYKMWLFATFLCTATEVPPNTALRQTPCHRGCSQNDGTCYSSSRWSICLILRVSREHAPGPSRRRSRSLPGSASGLGGSCSIPRHAIRALSSAAPRHVMWFFSTRGRSPSGRPLFWAIEQFLNSSVHRYAS